MNVEKTDRRPTDRPTDIVTYRVAQHAAKNRHSILNKRKSVRHFCSFGDPLGSISLVQVDLESKVRQFLIVLFENKKITAIVKN